MKFEIINNIEMNETLEKKISSFEPCFDNLKDNYNKEKIKCSRTYCDATLHPFETPTI